jgi:ankyrin repeat protein
MAIDANAASGPGHESGVTALDAAVAANRLEVVKTLLQLGAHPDLSHPNRRCGILGLPVWPQDAAIIEALVKAGARTDCDENHPGGTALMIAAGERGGLYVKVLIEAGVDVNAFDDEGRSALTEAAEANNVEAALLLLKAGADPNKPSAKERDLIGSVPLFTAIRAYEVTRDPTMTKLLLDNGADPNTRFTLPSCCPENTGGVTALTMVAAAGFEPLAAPGSAVGVGGNPAVSCARVQLAGPAATHSGGAVDGKMGCADILAVSTFDGGRLGCA